jgi:hypothetical protein
VAFDSAAMETAAGRKIRIRWPAGDGADGGKTFLVKNVSHFEEFKWITSSSTTTRRTSPRARRRATSEL